MENDSKIIICPKCNTVIRTKTEIGCTTICHNCKNTLIIMN